MGQGMRRRHDRAVREQLRARRDAGQKPPVPSKYQLKRQLIEHERDAGAQYCGPCGFDVAIRALQRCTDGEPLALWNDEPGRTVSDVVALMERARDMLRAEEKTA